MTEYKVGDKVRILQDQCYRYAPNGIYKAGEIHTVAGVDECGDPWFEGDKASRIGWGNFDNWFEKITDETDPSHKYKVGDKVRILKEMTYSSAPNGIYKAGEIHEVVKSNSTGICFAGDESACIGWSEYSKWFEKIEDQKMTKYKTGDKVRILKDQTYPIAPNGAYKAGEIHAVAGVDDDGNPWFYGDKNSRLGWSNYDNWFEKIEKYKIGDKVRILKDKEYKYAPNGIYKKGEIYTVAGVEERNGFPRLEGDDNFGMGWGNFDNWFEKITDETETKPIVSDPVNNPAHYTAHPSGIECIQITEHMNFNLGNAVKYIWRADLKGNSIEDLEKAAWYINREISKRKV